MISLYRSLQLLNTNNIFYEFRRQNNKVIRSNLKAKNNINVILFLNTRVDYLGLYFITFFIHVI